MYEQISFKHGRIRNRPYAHGGFFGAAPFMLANPNWKDILQQLMPEVYEKVSQQITDSPAYKLIHWAENNPVVAAYGTVHELLEIGMCAQHNNMYTRRRNNKNGGNGGIGLANSHISNPPNLEWDVFLDPVLVKQVERALLERDRFLRFKSSLLDQNDDNDNYDNASDINNNNIDKHDGTNEICTSYSYTSSTCSYWSLSQQPQHYQQKAHEFRLQQQHWIPEQQQQQQDQQFQYPPPLAPNHQHHQQHQQRQQQYQRQEHQRTLEHYDLELQTRVQELVDKMLIAHGNLTQLILEQTGYAKRYNYSRVERTCTTLGGGITARQWMAVYAEALRLVLKEEHEDLHQGGDIDMARSESFSTATDYYSHDENSNAVRPQQQQENTTPQQGNNTTYNNQYQYEYHTSEYFHEEQDNHSNSSSAYLPHKTAASVLKKCLSHKNRTIKESIDILKGITQQEEPVGIVLDIKSRHINKRVWACVVDALRSAGVRVEGISSFTINEIRDISRYCRTPVNEIFFFHSAGDLQRACHSGKIQKGDRVFFNAGSLLGVGGISIQQKQPMSTRLYNQIESLTITCYCSGYDPDDTKSNYRILPFAQCCRRIDGGDVGYDRVNNIYYYDNYRGSTIEQYKERYNLSIGLYCQEFAIDDAALDLIVKLVNENHETYNLGLSWGGVNGKTVKGIQPSRFSTTDGFANQRYVGAIWDSHLMPPPYFPPTTTPALAETDAATATATVASATTSTTISASSSSAVSITPLRSAE